MILIYIYMIYNIYYKPSWLGLTPSLYGSRRSLWKLEVWKIKFDWTGRWPLAPPKKLAKRPDSGQLRTTNGLSVAILCSDSGRLDANVHLRLKKDCTLLTRASRHSNQGSSPVSPASPESSPPGPSPSPRKP